MGEEKYSKVKTHRRIKRGRRTQEFYQKGVGYLKFRPSEYNGKSPQENRRLTYEDAKQHADFYKELVRQGVYPAGTKVKAKRKRHSDSYILEMWMPKITPLKKSLLKKIHESKIPKITKQIIETARKHGYEGDFQDDISIISPYEYSRDSRRNIPTHHYRNYGVDKKKKVRYIDADILMQRLPFKGRKNRREQTKEILERRESLENKVTSIIAAGSFVSALFFLSPNITGNAIGNLNQNTTNPLGIALLIIFVLFGLITAIKS